MPQNTSFILTFFVNVLSILCCLQVLTVRAYVGVRDHPAMGPAPISGLLTKGPEGKRGPVEEAGRGKALGFV